MDVEETTLTVGEWRSGLPTAVLSQIREVEGRSNQGYRQLPYESTVMYLVLLLDGYDDFAASVQGEEVDETVQ